MELRNDIIVEPRTFHKRLHLRIGTLIAVFLILIGGVQGGVPSEQWNKIYYRGVVSSVQQTLDGGYILIYYASGILKTDANGNELWYKTYDAELVQQTLDGGYILVGDVFIGDWTYAFIAKTDANGNEQWNKIVDKNSLDMQRIRGKSVQQTSDGGYIFAGWGQNPNSGSTNWDARLIKIDMNGNQQWNRTFGGNSASRIWSVQQTSDAGYILAGGPDSYFGAWLIKTDANGNEQWNKTLGSAQSAAYSVQQTSDGGYILAGRSTYFDTMLIKTDSNGNQKWSKVLSQRDSGQDEAHSVRQTKDGGYILVGYMFISGWMYAFIAKTDENGDQQWNRTLGGSVAYSVQQTSDGGYIVGGAKDDPNGVSFAWLVKFSDESSSTPTTTPTPTPIPTTPIPTPTPTITITSTSTPTPTITSTVTPTITPTSTPTVSPSITLAPTITQITTTPTSTPETPGFEAIFAAIGIVLVMALRLRRR